jgi:hypothetical protein
MYPGSPFLLAISGFEEVRKKKRERKLVDCKLNAREGKE